MHLSPRSLIAVPKAGLLGALALACVGCSGGPCTGNPNTDSVWCVQSGINSGTYQARVDAREAEARQAQQQVEVAKAENRSLEGQIADARYQEATLRNKLAAQRAELSRLASQIDAAQRAGTLTPGESDLQRAQVERLRQRQAELEQAKLQNREQNREMQQKAEALQREIDRLKADLAARRI